ncbi:PanD regulatory factor [compost metagenome]
MPVVVEILTEPTQQDLVDLQKIYHDAPQWLFAPYPDGQGLIDACLGDATLVAARFNDRLLGAARLQRQDSVSHISHLCVRKVTRRRGVGERLINESQKIAEQSGTQLHLLAPAGHLEAQALAAKLHLPLDIQADA